MSYGSYYNTPLARLMAVAGTRFDPTGARNFVNVYYIILYCIVLYCIVLYCIVLYCIVLCCLVLYCIVLYCIVLYCIVLYCIVLHYIFIKIFFGNTYGERDSSGSVKKLTKRVSLKRKYGELKLHILFNK